MAYENYCTIFGIVCSIVLVIVILYFLLSSSSISEKEEVEKVEKQVIRCPYQQPIRENITYAQVPRKESFDSRSDMQYKPKDFMTQKSVKKEGYNYIADLDPTIQTDKRSIGVKSPFVGPAPIGNYREYLKK